MKGRFMLINKNDKFSIRKFKNGRSDSVKIGAIGVIVGTAIALSAGSNSAEAAMKENSDNTTTISNDKGSVIVDTANIENPDAGRAFSTDPTAEGTNTITKTGKVDYKYVTAEGNTVLEENKNQNSGADKTIETTYNVYGKSGEVFKETTGGDAQDSDLNDAKENGKKATIEKDGKTYHLIGEPKVETTGNGGGVYSDTTLGDVTAKLTPEGLSNAEGKITYDTVKAGGKAWIVEQTGKGTYGKYVQADSGAITSDAKMVEAFKAGEAAAKDFTSANVTADGGIKEGDYVFVLEKNTYVTANTESQALTGSIPLSSSDNVADDVDGTGANLNRTYAMVQKFKAAPDTLTGVENKTLVKGYLAYLQGKGLEDNLLNFKRYVSIGLAGIAEDQVDAKGRPTRDLTADTSGVSNSDTLELEDGGFLLRLNAPSLDVEEYSYRDEITPLRAYRVASGTTTITYTYAEEKTREVEKKGSVVVNYQTEDGTVLKDPYTDTPETVVEVVTEHYYVNADGQEVVVEDKTVKTPKNVTYNTKENETEKPQKLTDAQGNVYYLNEANTKTTVNDQETTSPAETGTVVEGKTNVTYVYEKAGSVIVNYKTEDGTPLTGTVVGDESKTVESGAKDIDNGKPGTAYNTADNGMKPERIKTAEGKVYQLVPESTEGEETGEVESGTTKEVTYVYKEVKGNVVVKFEDTEGNVIAEDEKDETDASLNVKYDTADHKKDEITKDGVKYYLTTKELKDDSKPATGDVVEGTTTVTYVYEKAGQVVVNYQTEDGTPLVGTADGANVESGAKDTVDGRPGSNYNTADNGMKPNRITTAEGKVYELVPTATKGNETGKVAAGETKEVTYVYKEVKGNVVVKYEDTEGNVIAEDEKDETDASLNVKYDTADHKKDEITKDGVKYYLTAKELKDDSKPATGDVVEGTTTVTYVYEKAGQVVVNYQTEDGTPLVGTADGANIASGAKDTVDGRPGSDYNTADNGMKPNRITTAEGKVYELVPTATKGEETGKVATGETKEVTYVYKEVTGDVVVHYVDTEGNVIAEDKEDTKGASLNAKYDTTDNKPEKIEKDGTVYYLTAKALKDDSKPETGDVVEGKTNVTYVYEKAGSVIVNYQTEDGTPLVGTADGKDVASGVKDTDNGKPGSEYNTADNGMKPTRITTAEGKVYELVPTATKGEETGKVATGETKEVTYVYKEVTGDVVVHYVDTEGNKIAADKDDLKGASLSEKYDTAVDNKPEKITAEDGTVYYITKAGLKDDSKPETGNVVEGKTDVTYVYEKAGSVIVNYQTEDGTPLVGTADGKDIASGAKDTDNGKPGSKYNPADNGMKPTRITTAEGKVYELVPALTKGDETGTVESGQTKEVTYVYKEVKGNVVVKFEDAEGNTLAEDEKDETDASLNVKYDTADHKKAEITKDGVKYYLTTKELKADSKPATGDVVEGTTTVTYVYEKAGQVVVNYQTEDGTPLVGVDANGANVASGAKDTVDGRPGSDYNTADNGMKPNRITTAEGKVYELVPTATKGEETGKVATGETKEVTYVYKEVTGDVVVHYVDTEGNVIAEDKEDTKGASLNAKYDTTDNKPATIEKDGVKYYLTEKAVKDDSKPETGDVVEGKTEVTYVYEKAGQVVVHYTDEKGNTIQVDAVDTKDGKPNADYNTADNDMKPNRITTAEGKVYELIPQSTKGDETGKVKAGETTEVTYVYKEITGNVVVHYVDTEGNTLAADTKDVENGSLSEKYDTTDKKTEKIEKDGTVYYLTAKELKEDSKPENGTVVEGTTEITYVYEKAGQVVVHYVDEAGNTLQTDAVDTKDGKPGAKYDTSDNDMKPTRITTAEGKVYELVPASTKGNETGDVEAGKTTEVTYVYKEVKEIDKNKNLTPNNPVQPAKPGEETPNNPTQPAKPGEETPNKPAQPAKSGEETPNKPAQPAKPGEATTPATPSSPAETAEPGKANPNVATGTTVATKQQELPNTGTGNEVSIFGAAATAILASLGLVIPGKKRDEE